MLTQNTNIVSFCLIVMLSGSGCHSDSGGGSAAASIQTSEQNQHEYALPEESVAELSTPLYFSVLHKFGEYPGKFDEHGSFVPGFFRYSNGKGAKILQTMADYVTALRMYEPDNANNYQWCLTYARDSFDGIEAIGEDAGYEQCHEPTEGERVLVEPFDIDFSSNRVLLFDMGTRFNLGYQLSVSGVEEFSNYAVVHTVLSVPGPDCLTLQALTNPSIFIAVPTTKELLTAETLVVRQCE